MTTLSPAFVRLPSGARLISTCALFCGWIVAGAAASMWLPGGANGVAGTSSRAAFAKRSGGAFIRNQGQWDAQAQFFAQGKGVNIWITDSGVVYDFRAIQTSVPDREVDAKANMKPSATRIRGHVVRMRFDGAMPTIVRGADELQTRYNFFLGDKSKWAANVPGYAEAVSERIYHGISARYYFDSESPRYDLIVEPGADPSKIAMAFEGSLGLSADKGVLKIMTSLGVMEHKGLYAYQGSGAGKKQVAAEFDVRGNSVGFKLGDYDRSKKLVIDPIVWSTFIGGADNEVPLAIALDGAGNNVTCGFAIGTGFPVSAGAYDTTVAGLRDVAVAKLSSDGQNLLWATFVGGALEDEAWGIAVDAAGNIGINGHTRSSDFPTPNGADTTFGGSRDAFVLKLDSTGSNLLWSTFQGGSSVDRGDGIAFDSAGNAFVAGFTQSPDFTVSAGAYTTGFMGARDAYVAKYDPSGALVFSSLMGGESFDRAVAITVDSSGNPVFTGNAGINFPTTGGAYSSTLGDESDALVASLSADGSTLLWSTYIGGLGVGIETGWDIKLDSSGDVRIIGQTTSEDFPLTAGAIRTLFEGTSEGFVCELNSTGTALNWSTFLGGTDGEFPNRMVIDSSGNTLVVGYTTSPDFPVTAGADYTTHAGGQDWFITKLNPTGTSALYSTFVGTPQNDLAQAIAVDAAGNAYVCGSTFDPGFPSTAGSYDPSHNGLQDFVVMKIGFAMPPPIAVNDVYRFVAGDSLTVAAPGFLSNDQNVSGATVVVAAGFPVHAASVNVNQDGSFSYTPEPGFIGNDHIPYDVTTPSGTAQGIVYLVVQNEWLTLDLDNNTVFGGDPITGSVTTKFPIEHANFFNTGFIYWSDQFGTYDAGRIPDGEKTGTFSIPTEPVQVATTKLHGIALSGGLGGRLFTVTILPRPKPTAVDDLYIVPANSVLSVPNPGFLLNDLDATGATVHVTKTPINVAGFGWNSTDGAFHYTTPPDYLGLDTADYFARNASGDSNVATATFQVVNAVKSVQSGAPSFRWGSQITGTVTLEVADPNNPTTVTLADDHGNVLAEGVQVVVPAGATASTFFVPTQTLSTSQMVTISATINNGSNVTKSVSVNMAPVPVGVPDNYLAAIGTTLSVPAPGVLSNDQFGTLAGSRVAQLLQTTTRGTLSLNASGGFTYTPFNNLTGPDTFTYRPNTSSGILGSPTTVTIQVRNRLFKLKVLNNPTGGTPVQAYIELFAPSVGTTTVTLLEATPLLFGNGMTVTVPNGAKQSAVFNVPTAVVTTNTTVSLTATLGNGTPDVSAAVTIKK